MGQSFVVNIREQYPLWPYPHQSPLKDLHDHYGLALKAVGESAGTLALSMELGIRHARFIGLKIPYVYTTDQLLSVELPEASISGCAGIKY